jgi:hypothetical protein
MTRVPPAVVSVNFLAYSDLDLEYGWLRSTPGPQYEDHVARRRGSGAVGHFFDGSWSSDNQGSGSGRVRCRGRGLGPARHGLLGGSGPRSRRWAGLQGWPLGRLG